LRSRTQTVALDELQARTGELWGKPAVWSIIPAAKAYMGPLPPGQSGLEFTTHVAPASPNVPAGCDVYWYAGLTPGTKMNDQGFAVMPSRW